MTPGDIILSKTISGLQYDRKTKQWSIDKRIKNHGRIRQRLKATSTDEAETAFYKIIAELQDSNQRAQHGIMTFNEAATRYVNESTKRNLDRDIYTFTLAKTFIGSLTLSQIYMATLQALIEYRRKERIRSATVKRRFGGDS